MKSRLEAALGRSLANGVRRWRPRWYHRPMFKFRGPSVAQAPVPEPTATSIPPEDDQVRTRYLRRERFLVCDAVADFVSLNERFTILEGGAADSFSDTRWQAFDPARKRLYGFEPNREECDALNAKSREMGLDYRFYPIGLWREPCRLPLYENKSGGGTSFYRQDTALTDRWKFESSTVTRLAKDTFYPTGTSEWDLTTIDKWAAETGVSDIDFLKLNVQGAELDILQGATSILDNVIGMQVEVAFVVSYRDRPMFADVDKFLRSKGFTFFELIGHHCIGRADSPITAQQAPGLYGLYGQMIEAHGVYFRDPIDMLNQGQRIDHLTTAKLLKLAGFAEMYGQHEFCFELLRWLSRRDPKIDAMTQRCLETYRHYVGGWTGVGS